VKEIQKVLLDDSDFLRGLIEALCGDSVSKSMISSLAKNLDGNIHRWRNRKLTNKYPYIVVDARYEDIRQYGIVVGQNRIVTIQL